jgi:hypothetical protein
VPDSLLAPYNSCEGTGTTTSASGLLLQRVSDALPGTPCGDLAVPLSSSLALHARIVIRSVQRQSGETLEVSKSPFKTDIKFNVEKNFSSIVAVNVQTGFSPETWFSFRLKLSSRTTSTMVPFRKLELERLQVN